MNHKINIKKEINKKISYQLKNNIFLTLDVLTYGVTYSWDVHKNSIFAKYKFSIQLEQAISVSDITPENNGLAVRSQMLPLE